MRLNVAAQVTADANGKAVARLQPLRAFERWNIEGISISSTSVTKMPSFKLYSGSEADSNFIDGTLKGGLNTDPSLRMTLENGEVLVGVWYGCDVGSTCVMKPIGNVEGR